MCKNMLCTENRCEERELRGDSCAWQVCNDVRLGVEMRVEKECDKSTFK